jgi:hypothetical protein
VIGLVLVFATALLLFVLARMLGRALLEQAPGRERPSGWPSHLTVCLASAVLSRRPIPSGFIKSSGNPQGSAISAAQSVRNSAPPSDHGAERRHR